ncbi:collagen, type I, alpha 1a-like [Prinia subflava]|uniref:collagen, type I, alpha 1a-like n=1 Tax=Prinia subflava TaxID=208062 RepID=UPI002FE01850
MGWDRKDPGAPAVPPLPWQGHLPLPQAAPAPGSSLALGTARDAGAATAALAIPFQAAIPAQDPTQPCPLAVGAIPCVLSLCPLSPAPLQLSWSPFRPCRGSELSLDPSPLQGNIPSSPSLAPQEVSMSRGPARSIFVLLLLKPGDLGTPLLSSSAARPAGVGLCPAGGAGAGRGGCRAGFSRSVSRSGAAAEAPIPGPGGSRRPRRARALPAAAGPYLGRLALGPSSELPGQRRGRSHLPSNPANTTLPNPAAIINCARPRRSPGPRSRTAGPGNAPRAGGNIPCGPGNCRGPRMRAAPRAVVLGHSERGLWSRPGPPAPEAAREQRWVWKSSRSSAGCSGESVAAGEGRIARPLLPAGPLRLMSNWRWEILF